MLRDLFFNIWYDDIGSGWLLFTIVLFLLSLVILISGFARMKATNSKFSRRHLIGLGLIILMMYQIVPSSLNFIAMVADEKNIKSAINMEQTAIKLSLIPWQKGGYYCNLASMYITDKDIHKMYESYDTAYKYLKSYKPQCWGLSFLSFYTRGDYDKAIEIAKNYKSRPALPNRVISNSYLMKGDIENAELHIDKDISVNETYSNLATKAYILKAKGQKANSVIYYRKALKLCKNEKELYIATSMYANFVAYEKNRLSALRKQQGLE